MEAHHVPVMLDETVEYLALEPAAVVLDATCGLGGHTVALAARLATGFVIACDRDTKSLEMARERARQHGLEERIRFHHAAFSELGPAPRQYGVEGVDGLLADLGVSRYQLTTAERGFSILADGPLDMRMDSSRQQVTAADLVNYSAEHELIDIISRLGEQKGGVRKIVRALIAARPIHTTGQLARAVEKVLPRTGKLHPATLVFQGLRRKVNEEEEELDRLLKLIPELVKPGGRAVFLTYMSLEDRQVKVAFRDMARGGKARLLAKHVIRPTETEVRNNPAARSAKLRAVERVKEDPESWQP